MMVAQRLPASREMVENNAAVNARPRPISARRNLIHTSALVDCSHSATRFGNDALDFNGLATVEPTLSKASIPRENGQSTFDRGKSVRNRPPNAVLDSSSLGKCSVFIAQPFVLHFSRF